MQNNNGKYLKKKARLPLSVYLCYVLALTLVLSGVTMSRYTSSASGTATAKVAKFDVKLNSGLHDTAWTMSSLTSSKSTEQTFVVDNTGSDVPITYDIIVTLTKAPVSGITISVDGSSITAASNRISCTKLSAGSSRTHKIKIMAAGQVDATEFISDISVKIEAQQVD